VTLAGSANPAGTVTGRSLPESAPIATVEPSTMPVVTDPEVAAIAAVVGRLPPEAAGQVPAMLNWTAKGPTAPVNVAAVVGEMVSVYPPPLGPWVRLSVTVSTAKLAVAVVTKVAAVTARTVATRAATLALSVLGLTCTCDLLCESHRDGASERVQRTVRRES
jgi:hypothetical protein